MNDPEQSAAEQPAVIDRRSASQPTSGAVVAPFLPERYKQPQPPPPQPVARPVPPALASRHTNGRREERLHAAMTRPRKTIATVAGTITGPITRAAPKRPAGVSARQWKRQRRLERERGSL